MVPYNLTLKHPPPTWQILCHWWWVNSVIAFQGLTVAWFQVILMLQPCYMCDQQFPILSECKITKLKVIYDLNKSSFLDIVACSQVDVLMSMQELAHHRLLNILSISTMLWSYSLSLPSYQNLELQRSRDRWTLVPFKRRWTFKRTRLEYSQSCLWVYIFIL